MNINHFIIQPPMKTTKEELMAVLAEMKSDEEIERAKRIIEIWTRQTEQNLQDLLKTLEDAKQ